MRKFVMTALILTSLAACQTVAGAGRDVQSAGSAMTSSANSTQAKM